MTRSAIVKSVEIATMEAEHRAKKFGTVYFVTNPDQETVKIGFTKHLGRRMEVLQTGNHVHLLAYSGFRSTPQAERILHRLLRKHRIRNEWFTHADEVDELIECFEDFIDETDDFERPLTAEDIEFVLNDWANSYGRGASRGKVA
ncbi:GIY-YIG nuclease family protein [Rhizobium sp. NZLR11]|uniref:GIY-YIG nuclease family protein n=1 Tax=Rhizobium sp. NZLR11 TaxID=2731098 RepID=UPI001C834333|nr:GIY-YIG nuclease family protein [Rhizobium sp. NZLR11]MBX5206737.1 GIY-YIG nuclease family protein [Rhizobium sp. NZLR11]